MSWSSSPIARQRRPVTTAPNIARQGASGRNTPTPTSSSSMAQAELLPAELGGLLDAVKPLQRQDRIRQLVGAAVQYGTGQRQEFLLHRLGVRESGGLAGGIGVEAFMHA